MTKDGSGGFGARVRPSRVITWLLAAIAAAPAAPSAMAQDDIRNETVQFAPG